MALSPYVQAMQELFRANTRSREFPAHGAKVHSVAWSCCGRRLASGSFDKTASVFLLEKDRLVSNPAGGGVSVPGTEERLEPPLGPVLWHPRSPWAGTDDSDWYRGLPRGWILGPRARTGSGPWCSVPKWGASLCERHPAGTGPGQAAGAGAGAALAGMGRQRD